MPLIVITGTPCSGKTYRAQQIQAALEHKLSTYSNGDTRTRVVCIPSHHASLDPLEVDSSDYEAPPQDANPRDQIYASAKLEKTSRAEEFSAVKRAVDKHTIVIADAPNYIKGYRYQLFCEAKAAGTRSCVVHCSVREDESRSWNNARLKARGWSTEDDQEIKSETAPSISGPKIGGDVRGDLEPESHTAIYGDKPVNDDATSETSSVGAAVSEDGNDEAADERRRRKEDTMTLKSLYIHDNEPDTSAFSSSSNIEPTTNQTSPIPVLSISDTIPSTPPTSNSSLPYSPSTFTSLHMRYEPPSPFTRWDTPLFTVPSTDVHPPYTQIWDALFPMVQKSTSAKARMLEQGRIARAEREARQNAVQAVAPSASNNGATSSPSHSTSNTNGTQTINLNAGVSTTVQQSQGGAQVEAVRKHASTVLPTAAPQNALQLLESTTGELVKLVLRNARDGGCAGGEGGIIPITFPTPPSGPVGGGDDDADGKDSVMVDIEVPEGVQLSQPMLQRLRRKYTGIQRGGLHHSQGIVTGREGVARDFLAFLQREFEALVDG